MSLRPYSGPDALCAKCGGGPVSTSYRPAQSCNDFRPLATREHQRRCCRNCGYTWAEGVAKPPAGSLAKASGATVLNVLVEPGLLPYSGPEPVEGVRIAADWAEVWDRMRQAAQNMPAADCTRDLTGEDIVPADGAPA